MQAHGSSGGGGGAMRTKVVVIGAGISGVVLAAELQRQKAVRCVEEDLVILERGGGYGGVWWQNRYPGIYMAGLAGTTPR